MIPPATPGLSRASLEPRQPEATRVALALCLARERHDPEGLRCLGKTLPPPVLIAALIGAVRAPHAMSQLAGGSPPPVAIGS